MANEALKAQFALMAALQPEQFIEMAVAQGFTPEEMTKSIPGFKRSEAADDAGRAETRQGNSILSSAQTQGSVPPPPITAEMGIPMIPGAPPTGQLPPAAAPPVNLLGGVPSAFLPTPPAPSPFIGPPPMAGAVQPGGPPAMGNPGQVSPGALSAVQSGGAPPPIGVGGGPPAMGNPGQVSPGALSAIQSGGAPPPMGVGQPPMPGSLSSLITPGGPPPQPPFIDLSNVTVPPIQMPGKMPDVIDMAAGALGGLAAQAVPSIPPGADVLGLGSAPSVMPPVPSPFMGPPPTGALPHPGMGNPGEVSPQAMAAMPAPQTGLINPPTVTGQIQGSALSNIVPADSELARILGLAPETLVPAGSALAQILGGGAPMGTPPGLPQAPLPGINPLVSGPIPPSENVVVAPPVTPSVVPPPPPQPTVQDVASSLSPVTKAGVKTVTPDKTPPATGSPEERKKTFDSLAAVGRGMQRGGGRDGRPGSSGVRGGQIQPGEITDLLARLLAPNQFTPGFIPYNRMF